MAEKFIGPEPKKCVGGPAFESLLKPPPSVLAQNCLPVAATESQEEQKSPEQKKKCVLKIKRKQNAPQSSAHAAEQPRTAPQGEASEPSPFSLQSSTDRDFPAVVTNLSDLFTCQGCQNEFEQWMLYIDVPCPSHCRVCHRCLYEQKSCPVCRRCLSAEEQGMVLIYYQSFLPSDWSSERILEESSAS